MERSPAFTADVPRPRRRERPWEQPEYIRLLHDLPCVITGGPVVTAHHLIHHHRLDRRRRDDRLVLPLCWGYHSIFHSKVGDEARFFRELGIADPYALAEELWRIYEKGWDRDEAIRAIVGARHG